MPLLIGSPDKTEVVFEEVMALEPEKLTSHFPVATAGDLRDRDLGVIVADSLRHTAEELKGSLVSFQKRFGAFSWESLNEDRIGVRKRHHEQRDLDVLAGEVHFGESEVDLCLARRMGERQKDLLASLLPFPDDLLDGGVTATVAVLLLQPLKDPRGTVSLLLGSLLVCLKNRMNDLQIRLDRWSRARLRLSIARWFVVLENLLERVPVEFVLSASCSLAHFAGEYAPADLGPEFHILVHPIPPQKSVETGYWSKSRKLGATFFNRRSVTARRYVFGPPFTSG